MSPNSSSSARSGVVKGRYGNCPTEPPIATSPCPEMVDEAEPVFMIDGREIPVEELRVDQKRTAGNEWFLPAPGQASRMSHDRRVRVFLDLESHDRVVVQQRRRRTQLGHVQLADVVVKEEHPRPAAHAADQQAEVAFPADVERAGGHEALRQGRAEVKQVIPGTRANRQQRDLARPEPVENIREPEGEAVGVDRDQVAPGVRRELYCRAEVLRRTDSRNDDRIDEGLRDGPAYRTGYR